VARGFSSQPRELAELIKRGIQHRGFSFIQVMSPCVTYFDTYAHFKESVAPLPEGHDPADRLAAMKLALEAETTYLGVFYEDQRPVHDAEVKRVQEKAGAGFSFESLLESFER
jgi:2-oxoglutarate ferredoxin oxidoreductase subunit beta